ncbi:MAG TPA: protein phosphatase 2C domain-containing protein [Saprospiraceae bacterium]|nr:protein phosphatase 2C domain-containing protein [Saprospiraceae bacterium]
MITNRPPKFADSFTSRSRKRVFDDSMIKSIGVAVTGSNKALNQDFCSHKYIESANVHIIAVADGVGSHKYAEVGSEFVVGKSVELLTDLVLRDPNSIDFGKLFEDIQNGLDEFIQENYSQKEELVEGACFGTTLLIGIDLPEKFIAAYIGNGSIFHISGYFANFPQSIYLPWNSVNMLNPHTVEQDGKEALYKIFTWKGIKPDYTPTVFQIMKNKDLPGEIFVVATDGVNSSDQLLPGKDDDGAIWIPSSKTTEYLYHYLKNFLLNKEIEHNQLMLEKSINEYLAELKDKKIMYDDTTLGVIITGNCLKYFEEKRIEI